MKSASRQRGVGSGSACGKGQLSTTYDYACTSPSVLVIAHPGHELRVYGWLSRARPLVYVITDGSGHTGVSRLGTTTELLAQVTAKPGSIYGAFTDRQVYSAIIANQAEPFLNLVDRLAEQLVSNRVDYVVGDAIEGYSPTHDLCRVIINAAVVIARRVSHRQIGNFDFPLVGRPDSCPPDLMDNCIRIDLDSQMFAKKIEAARSYPEISADVTRAFDDVGRRAFSVELLRPVNENVISNGHLPEKPFYETYGEKRVADGYYDCVLRYREHFLPFIQTIVRYAEDGPESPG